jgi:hypothetical protein
MPVRFDANRVIRLDHVDVGCLLGQLYIKFTLSSASRITSPNLVKAAGLEKINESEVFWSRRYSFGRFANTFG